MKASTGEDVDIDELGSGQMHTSKSGLVDHLAEVWVVVVLAVLVVVLVVLVVVFVVLGVVYLVLVAVVACHYSYYH